MSILWLVVIIGVTCALNLNAPASNEDNAPDVSVLEVDTSYVVLTVTGNTKINGSPVASIEVSDALIDAYKRNGLRYEKKEVQSHPCADKFSKTVKITQLLAGRKYYVTVWLVNTKGEKSNSATVSVLLLPQTPRIEVAHEACNKLVLYWRGGENGFEDYFVIKVIKDPFSECKGITMKVPVCFTMQHSFNDLQKGLYRIIVKSHNPSGFSPSTIIDYRIE